MGIVDINGISKLIVFGGTGDNWKSSLDSIEEWDDDKKTWSLTTIKLFKARCNFGYCQLPQF